MNTCFKPLALVSLILSGAIFGFFYAWVCSTMWGLDAAAPDVAIQAMQAMNASVRNPVFAPAFFGTPVVLSITAWLAFRLGRAKSGFYFAAAALIYLLGGLVLTLTVSVPLNESLARVVVPLDLAAAKLIWLDYSISWQFWNVARTMASAIALLMVGFAFIHMHSQTKLDVSIPH
jgi:uncharacterized membrane protein